MAWQVNCDCGWASSEKLAAGYGSPLKTVVAHWVSWPVLFNLYFGKPTVKSQGLVESAPERPTVGPLYSAPLIVPVAVEVVTELVVNTTITASLGPKLPF